MSFRGTFPLWLQVISRGERSLGVGCVGWVVHAVGATSREIRYGFNKGVSHSCLVETLHLPAPLQVNNRGRSVCTLPQHLRCRRRSLLRT